LYPCACHTKKEMHSRDATFLIDFLWFNVVHYSSLFQHFFQSTMVPTLVENSYFFTAFVCKLFWKHYYDDYDWKTIQGWIQGSSKGSMEPPPPFASDRPLTLNRPFCKWQTLDKLLKSYIGKLKSVYYYTTRFYNKTLTFSSFFTTAKSLKTMSSNTDTQ